MKLNIQQRQQLVDEYNKQMADLIRELAAKYGISIHRVRDIVREVKWPEDLPSNHPNHALILKALRLRVEGYTYQDIATQIGRSPTIARRYTKQYKLPV